VKTSGHARVPRNLIEHLLNIDPKATPKRQHLRRFADDRRDAIKKELAKLLAAGFIRYVFHPKWLANPVLVRKKNSNEWRMCVDYTDLNKHCPKDPFGLPRIDQVIDSTAGCDLLCFLDCYSGYHQFAIKEEDQEKTAFVTPFGAYLLTVNSCIKVRLDLQADKSPVAVKGPLFPRVVNPRYRIRGTNV
jgi:hypothetical protein